MTVHGRADIVVAYAGSAEQSQNEIFASICGFMTSSNAQALGIQLVESNWGTNGRGLGFWDTSTNAGRNAWAIFRFTSASLGKFDMALYVNSGTDGASFTSWNPNGLSAVWTLQSTAGAVGVQFAAHPSSSTIFPWNGSSSSFSAGTQGSPIWHKDPVGNLCVFPRQNTPDGGAFGGSFKYMTMLAPDVYSGSTPALNQRMHLICTEDSFTFLHASADSQNYQITHFGSYTPRSGTEIQVPYTMFVTPGGGCAPEYYSYATYGQKTSAGGSVNVREGGIAHPTSSNGTKTLSLFSVITFPDASIGGFNKYVASGTYEVCPLFVAIKDGTDFGILGQLNNVFAIFGTSPHTTSPSSGTCAFGPNTSNSNKWLTWWSGSKPGTVSSRTGRDF